MQFDAKVPVRKEQPTALDTSDKIWLSKIAHAKTQLLSLRRRLQAKRFLVQIVAASMVYHSVSGTWQSLGVLQALHLCRRRMMPEKDIVHIESKRGINGEPDRRVN